MKMTDQVFAKSGISLYSTFKLHLALFKHKETFQCIQSPGFIHVIIHFFDLTLSLPRGLPLTVKIVWR